MPVSFGERRGGLGSGHRERQIAFGLADAKQLVHQARHIGINHLAARHPDDITYGAKPGVPGVSATGPSCNLTRHA